MNFDLSTQTSQEFALWLVPCAKYITIDLKKNRGVICHDTEELCEIWRKTDWWFGKWHEKFDNFHQTTRKCQNWEFDGILLPKVENACAKIYRGVMTNDTEEWWKNWRGIILLFQNWGIWRIWPKHLKVSKIWTLMAGSFWKKFIMFELKKHWGAIFLETEKWCEIWWETDLLFQDWNEEFEEFWSEHSKAKFFIMIIFTQNMQTKKKL